MTYFEGFFPNAFLGDSKFLVCDEVAFLFLQVPQESDVNLKNGLMKMKSTKPPTPEVTLLKLHFELHCWQGFPLQVPPEPRGRRGRKLKETTKPELLQNNQVSIYAT